MKTGGRLMCRKRRRKSELFFNSLEHSQAGHGMGSHTRGQEAAKYCKILRILACLSFALTELLTARMLQQGFFDSCLARFWLAGFFMRT